MNTRSIFTLIFMAGTALYAQGPGGRGPRTPPTPVQIAQRETDRLTRFFTLDATQQGNVLGILTTEEGQIQALALQIPPLRTMLTAAIKANNTGLIGSTLSQISNLEEQEQVLRANAAGTIYVTILNASQQTKIGKGLGPLMGGGPGLGGRGPGGFGPGRGNRN